MTLDEIITKAKRLDVDLENKKYELIQEYKKRLIEILQKNEPNKHPEEDQILFYDINNKSYSFRYCGRFYNSIIIAHNPLNDELYLKACMTADDTPTDRRENREDFVSATDLDNFRSLVSGLEPFYRGTAVADEYTELRKELHARCEADRLQRDMIELLNDDMQGVMDETFTELFKGEDIRMKDAILLLPKGFCLHIRGMYYNAVISGNEGVRLAYVKPTMDFCSEEEYCRDRYTTYREDMMNVLNIDIIQKETLWTYGHNHKDIIDILENINTIITDPVLLAQTKRYIL